MLLLRKDGFYKLLIENRFFTCSKFSWYFANRNYAGCICRFQHERQYKIFTNVLEFYLKFYFSVIKFLQMKDIDFFWIYVFRFVQGFFEKVILFIFV